MRNYIFGIASAILLVALIGGAYYFGTQKLNPIPEQDMIVTPTEKSEVTEIITTNTPVPTPVVELTNNVREQIIAVIKTKNTQPLEGYTTDTVSVRLESSSCCGVITKAEAISQLSYLDQATGWDFNATNPIIVSLASASPDYYGSGWTVGVASNEYVFSFKLNSENKMDAYNIASTYKLLVP